MAINLDQKFNNVQQRVIIAGHEYALTFDDQFAKKVARVQLKVRKQLSNATKKENETKFDDMSLDEQYQYTDQQFDEVKRVSQEFFDETFGEGVGKKIYKFYKGSTEALADIISMLDDESHKLQVEKEKDNSAKYLSKKR